MSAARRARAAGGNGSAGAGMLPPSAVPSRSPRLLAPSYGLRPHRRHVPAVHRAGRRADLLFHPRQGPEQRRGVFPRRPQPDRGRHRRVAAPHEPVDRAAGRAERRGLRRGFERVRLGGAGGLQHGPDGVGLPAEVPRPRRGHGPAVSGRQFRAEDPGRQHAAVRAGGLAGHPAGRALYGGDGHHRRVGPGGTDRVRRPAAAVGRGDRVGAGGQRLRDLRRAAGGGVFGRDQRRRPAGRGPADRLPGSRRGGGAEPHGRHRVRGVRGDEGDPRGPLQIFAGGPPGRRTAGEGPEGVAGPAEGLGRRKVRRPGAAGLRRADGNAVVHESRNPRRLRRRRPDGVGGGRRRRCRGPARRGPAGRRGGFAGAGPADRLRAAVPAGR